jgi:hypothetical protein
MIEKVIDFFSYAWYIVTMLWDEFTRHGNNY